MLHRKRTSVEVSWWDDWFNQSLAVGFYINHKNICRVSLLDLVILGPAASTEAHKRAPYQKKTECNYNCVADYLSKAQTCTPGSHFLWVQNCF